LFPLHLEFPLPQPHRPSPTSQVVTVWMSNQRFWECGGTRRCLS
jgi:hypothetical protein